MKRKEQKKRHEEEKEKEEKREKRKRMDDEISGSLLGHDRNSYSFLFVNVSACVSTAYIHLCPLVDSYALATSHDFEARTDYVNSVRELRVPL